ncbi:hypothetical protein V1264_019925 [Littorina saxatilis]|uniref:Uncharacterized protein n=1 Tax=Littorina saxatilis TaxID=31220 RepID=A0AAN9B8Z6_9CAEN
MFILIFITLHFSEPEKRETHLTNPDLRGFLALVRNRRAEGDCGDTNDQCTFDQDRCCSGFYCKSSTWSAFCTAIEPETLDGAAFMSLVFKNLV